MKSETHATTWFNPTKAEIKEIGPAMIAFDFDSTINEMGEPLGEYIAAELGCDVGDVRGRGPEGERTFHFEHSKLTSYDMAGLVHKYVCEETPSLLPTPWAGDVLSYIYQVTEQPITVITYRPKDSVEVTYDWLVENLNVPFNLIMLQGMPKHVVLQRLGTEMFIDDRYKTVQSLENVVNISVLYSRVWNQGRAVEAGHMTVSDLRGLIPIVNFMTRQPIMNWPGNIPYPDRIGRGKVVDLYA